MGRILETGKVTLQDQMLQPNGCIRYLNTGGFAIRRTRVDIEAGLFHPRALRAEDTLLLADLIQAGELPFFVNDAVVEHSVSLSFLECLRKDVRSAWLEGKTYEMIAAKGSAFEWATGIGLECWCPFGKPHAGVRLEGELGSCSCLDSRSGVSLLLVIAVSESGRASIGRLAMKIVFLSRRRRMARKAWIVNLFL